MDACVSKWRRFQLQDAFWSSASKMMIQFQIFLRMMGWTKKDEEDRILREKRVPCLIFVSQTSGKELIPN